MIASTSPDPTGILHTSAPGPRIILTGIDQQAIAQAKVFLGEIAPDQTIKIVEHPSVAAAAVAQYVESHLVVVYTPCVDFVSHVVANNQDLEKACATWEENASALLEVVRQYRRKVSVIPDRAMNKTPDVLAKALAEQLNLGDVSNVPSTQVDADPEDFLLSLIVKQVVQSRRTARQLDQELTASTMQGLLIPSNGDAHFEMALESYQSFQAYQAAASEASDFSEELSQKDAELQDLGLRLEQAEKDKTVSNTELQNAQIQLEESRAQLQEAEDELMRSGAQLHKKEQELRKARGEMQHKEKSLLEKDVSLSRKDEQLEKKDQELHLSGAQLRQKEEELHQTHQDLKEKEKLLEEAQSNLAVSSEQVQLLEDDVTALNAHMNTIQKQVEMQFRTTRNLTSELTTHRDAAQAWRQELERVWQSRSWKITSPLRNARLFFSGRSRSKR